MQIEISNTLDVIKKRIEEFGDAAEEMFDDYLDIAYPDTSIVGHQYRTSRALKRTDPVAYKEMMAKWADSTLKEIESMPHEIDLV